MCRQADERTNPYLAGKVINEACFATNDDGTGNCPNGATAQYTSAAGGSSGAAAPCSYSSACAHGTHVAHTAAGAYGVARGATIVAIRASHPAWDPTSNAYQPSFATSDLGFALWYVHDILPKTSIYPAAVNISVGNHAQVAGTCDDPSTWVTYEINALKADFQVPVVVSSGNDNYANGLNWPACNSNAIAVGNTTLTSASGGVDVVFGGVSIGSNTGPTLDLLAPGTDICSAIPKNLDTQDGNANGWNCGWIGTSMAAPQVAGALAILTQKRPAATVDQLLRALQISGNTGGVAVTDSRNTSVTRTRINVANAVYYF